MAMISPVSDLRNYNVVLDKVEPGSPVFLTVNGRGRYTIRDIADDEEFEKTKAMLQLMMELYDGRQSGEEKGYRASSEVRERLKLRLAAKKL
ncbi:MAG: prevent-host-death protein [Clostridia bacterium]|nr:prevent-host-death protein [Clostridia bacterium]